MKSASVGIGSLPERFGVPPPSHPFTGAPRREASKRVLHVLHYEQYNIVSVI